MSTPSKPPNWVTLTEGESVLWSGHPSVYSIGPYAAVGTLVALAGVGLAFVDLVPSGLWWGPLVPIALGIALIVYAYLVRNSITYVITDEELYKKTGLLSRHVTKVRVEKVRNISTHQSFVQRFTSRGTVIIETATGGGIQFDYIDDLDGVSGILTSALDR